MTTTATVSCPRCQQRVTLRPPAPGMDQRCPGCGISLLHLLPRSAPAAPKPFLPWRWVGLWLLVVLVLAGLAFLLPRPLPPVEELPFRLRHERSEASGPHRYFITYTGDRPLTFEEDRPRFYLWTSHALFTHREPSPGDGWQPGETKEYHTLPTMYTRLDTDVVSGRVRNEIHYAHATLSGVVVLDGRPARFVAIWDFHPATLEPLLAIGLDSKPGLTAP